MGFQNSATGLDLGFYAARSYSLMRPPRTGRRLIRFWERSATGWSGRGGTVLDVHGKPSSVRLAAHHRYHEFGFDPAWSSWTSANEAPACSEAVDDYLDTVIPHSGRRERCEEGSVQAAVSSFGSARRAMLDREVMLHFRDTATKARIMGSATADLLQSLADAPVPGARPKAFGGRCDLLPIDSDGRLLAVEVKPKGVPAIAWTPAQAIVYAHLLRLWTRSDP